MKRNAVVQPFDARSLSMGERHARNTHCLFAGHTPDETNTYCTYCGQSWGMTSRQREIFQEEWDKQHGGVSSCECGKSAAEHGASGPCGRSA